MTSLQDQIVSLSTWYHSNQSQNNPTPLIDLRSADEFATKRLSFPNLKVVPFPVEFLKERSFELPARHVEFAILLSKSDLERAEHVLLGAKDNGRKRAQKPWLVTEVLIDDPELWNEAQELGIDDHSDDDRWEKGEEECFRPLPRLWQPDAMIQTVLLPLLLLPKEDSSLSDEIWDLASGAGRDVAFLAEELKTSSSSSTPSFRKVVGLDHRYNAKETRIVTDFWDRRGVGDTTECLKMDLSTFEGIEDTLMSSDRSVAALFAVRFWKPSLVEAICRSTKLKPGTLFGMSHFCKPFAGAPWNFAHPTEKTVLERNQLNEMFQDASNNWEILHDEIALDSDHGRSMIHFVARRR
eukprot:scaffold1697_cov120-Cylindrotheca_fusiformis.AAC.48